MWHKLYQFSSPPVFYRFSSRVLPWLWWLCGLCFVYGLFGGLVLAPPDYQQGDAFRMIYVHVPSAILSMGVYAVLTLAAIFTLIWRIKLADVIAQASVPLGAAFTFLVLVSGSLWGKPMWGTWWIWDARLTSELILLFIYLGLIALRSALTEPEQAARAVAIFTLVGAVDLPIIHYSVYWWNTLHQQATLFRLGPPTIAPNMLYPLLAMLGAFACYFLAVMLLRARAELLRRERRTRWVRELGV